MRSIEARHLSGGAEDELLAAIAEGLAHGPGAWCFLPVSRARMPLNLP